MKYGFACNAMSPNVFGLREKALVDLLKSLSYSKYSEPEEKVTPLSPAEVKCPGDHRARGLLTFSSEYEFKGYRHACAICGEHRNLVCLRRPTNRPRNGMTFNCVRKSCMIDPETGLNFEDDQQDVCGVELDLDADDGDPDGVTFRALGCDLAREWFYSHLWVVTGALCLVLIPCGLLICKCFRTRQRKSGREGAERVPRPERRAMSLKRTRCKLEDDGTYANVAELNRDSCVSYQNRYYRS